MSQTQILRRAEFDPKLKTYWFFGTALSLLFSFIGIPVLLPWFLGLGSWMVGRWFDVMSCELTDKALLYKRGFVFRVEKTIPLDKVQDLTLHEGPLLRYFGLSGLLLETAGGSASAQSGAARLTGVVDAPAFRDAVIEQRDRIAGIVSGASSAAASVSATEVGEPSSGVLVEIRDSLLRIEAQLEARR